MRSLICNEAFSYTHRRDTRLSIPCFLSFGPERVLTSPRLPEYEGRLLRPRGKKKGKGEEK